MKVFVACEYSGTVRDAFLSRGHDAISCDIDPTESEGPHMQMDVFSALEAVEIDGWSPDILIAHPPCKYLANSGGHWLGRQDGRWDKMVKGALFFRRLLEWPVPRVAVENPIMHKYAVNIIGRRQDQTIQPYEFGHPESKRTCLWLKGLPRLEVTDVLQKPACGHWENQTPSGQNKLGPSPTRAKERARFYSGWAEAMAEQWGEERAFTLKG